MTQILTTASGNFNNKKSWNGIKKHLEHDPNITHKNDFLNTDESKALRKYNQHVVLIDYEKFCEDNFGAYVEDHDAHMKDKKRQFGSVKRFLEVDNNGKARKLQPAQLYTEKFSNEEDYKRFLKLLVDTIKKQNPNYTDEKVKDTAYRIVNAGLMRYAKSFNERNPNLKMFEYYTHLDEEGAPHLHSRVMPFVKPNGTTKTGRLKKPSWSLNKALGTQYNNLGKNKENLRRFRKQEDEALIDSMNYVLERTCHLKPIFKLIRKTDKDQTLLTGLDHEVYKAKQHKLDELNTKINAKQNDLLAVTDAVSEQTEKLVTTTNKLKDTEAKNENLIKQQDEREKHLDARERDLNVLELGGVDSKGIKHVGLEQRKMALDDRETRLNSWATDLNAKEKSINQRIRDGIRAGMQKLLHPLKAFRHGYLNSLIHQQLNGVDEQQIKEIIKQQEDTYDKTAMVAALSGASGKGVQRQAVKAVGAGALAMAKDIPSYKQVSDAAKYVAEVQALEKEDERRKASVSKHVESKEATKDITDDF